MPANDSSENTPHRGVRWLRILLSTFGLLLLVLAGLTAYLLSDPGRIKTALENLLTSVTDRPFRVEGDFDISLGSVIDIKASKVVWENPPWSSTPNMLEIGEIELQFSFVSLFDQPVVITNSRAQDARLEFEWTEDGAFNWDFFANEPDDGDDQPLKAIPLLLDKAELKNVDILFRDPLLTKPLLWHIENAKQQQDKKNRLVLSADTQLNGRDLILQGRIGPFPELIIGGAVNMAARLKGPNQGLRVTASTDELLNLADIKFDLLWESPDVSLVLDALNLPTQATQGQVSVKAFLRTEDDKLVGKVDGYFGEFKVNGNLKAPETNTLTDLHADFSSSGPSARAFGRLLGLRDLPVEPYTLNFKADSVKQGLRISELYVATADAKLKASGLLPRPPTLIDADVNIKLVGKNLAKFQGITNDIKFITAPFSADFDLKGNGKDQTDSLTGKLTLSRMTGDISAELTERPDYTDSEISYSLVFPDAQKILGMFGVQVTTNKPLTAVGKLKVKAAGLQIENLKIQIEENKLLLDGLIPDAGSGKSIKLTSTTSGPSFSGLWRYYLPVALGPSKPFSLQGSIEINEQGYLNSTNKGLIGTTKLETRTRADMRDGAGTDMRVAIKASGPDLDEWLQDLVQEQRINDAFTLSGDVRITDAELSVSNLDMEVRKGRLRGDIVSGWPDDPESFKFDLTATGKDLAAELPKLSIYEPAAVGFELKAKGMIDASNIQIDYLRGNIGTAKLNILGGVGLPPAVTARSLTINIAGDSLSDLGKIEGWEVKDAPFAIDATVNSEGSVIEASNISITLGPSDLSGRIKFDNSSRPLLDAALVSKSINIGATLTKDQNEAFNAVADGTGESDGSRLIPDTSIPVELLNDFDANVLLEIATVLYREDKLSDIEFEGRLKDGALKVPDFRATTTLGNIRSSGSYLPDGDSYRLTVKGEANNVRLRGTKEIAGDLSKFKGYNVDLGLTGLGADLRSIARTADGFVWLRGGEWQMENLGYSSIFGDAFTQIGILINPFYKKDPYTNIVCEAFLFEVEDGVMETSPLVFIKTDKLNIMAVGSINLATERIRMGVETTPRKGIGLSAGDLVTPFVRIGGTLDKPKAEIDAKSSLIEGGAAVYTMGLSIVAKGLYKRWIKADRTCEAYEGIARKERAARDPENVPAD